MVIILKIKEHVFYKEPSLDSQFVYSFKEIWSSLDRVPPPQLQNHCPTFRDPGRTSAAAAVWLQHKDTLGAFPWRLLSDVAQANAANRTAAAPAAKGAVNGWSQGNPG